MVEREQGEEREIVSSALGSSTHAELRLLYEDSAYAVRFAKAMQWTTVGSTLLLYVALIAIAKLAPNSPGFVRGLSFITFLVSPTAVIMLVIYQMWQYLELEKQATIAKEFSSLFRDVRAIKSKLEANIHRYIFLLIMIVVVIGGNFVTYRMLELLVPK